MGSSARSHTSSVHFLDTSPTGPHYPVFQAAISKRTMLLPKTSPRPECTAAWRHRVRTKVLSIVPELGFAGQHAHRPYFGGINLEWDGSPRAQRRVEDMALVCCAGPAAQRRFNPKGFRSYHAGDDWRQAINLLSYLAGNDEILSAHFKLIDLHARAFVELQHIWPLITGVAEALLEREHLTGKEVRTVILDSTAAAVQKHAQGEAPPAHRIRLRD